MNNTKTTTLIAIVAIFMAATLVVGTVATTTLTQTALAYPQQKKGDDNSRNGNTVTIQKCKQAATQSGFDNNQGQECENLICTHPGENSICTQEGLRSISTPTPTPTPEPTTTTLRVIKKVVCQPTDPNCSLPDLCRINVVSPSTGTTPVFDCEDAIGNGVLVTLQPGEYFTEEVIGPGFDETDLSGDCSGTIAEGQHLTCTITNTENP